MGNKIFAVVVVLLWATSMSWLMVANILPSLFLGDPPKPAMMARHIPVAWRVELEGKPCGIVITQGIDGVAGSKEIHSRVLLDQIPLSEIAPGWMRNLLDDMEKIRLDMRTRVALDTLGGLASFNTRIAINDLPSLVRMDGYVEDGNLRLKLKTGGFTQVTERPWQGRGLLGSELTPEPKLLQVHVGKKWREEIYSPFASPSSPVELIGAEVVAEEKILFAGSLTNVKRIEYRTVSAGVSAADRLRAIVWVADDGWVLRQDAFFLNTRLRLSRLSDSESAELAEEKLELDLYATTTTPKRQLDLHSQEPIPLETQEGRPPVEAPAPAAATP